MAELKDKEAIQSENTEGYVDQSVLVFIVRPC